MHQESNNYRAVEAKAQRFLEKATAQGYAAGFIAVQYRQTGTRHLVERRVTRTNERGRGNRALARELKASSVELVHFSEPGEKPTTPGQRLVRRTVKTAKKLLGGPHFEIFAIHSSPDALANITKREVERAIERFQRSDWGVVTPEVKTENDKHVKAEKGLLHAHYHGARGSFVLVGRIGKMVEILLAEEWLARQKKKGRR